MPSLAPYLARILAVAVAVTTAPLAPSHAEAVTSSEMCAALSPEVGDCGCVISFLEDQLGRQEAGILLELWLTGLDRDPGHRTPRVASLYSRYGRKVLESVTSRFLAVRTRFQMQCDPPGQYLSE